MEGIEYLLVEALGPASLTDHGVEHPSLVHVCTQTDNFMSVTNCYFYSVNCPDLQLPTNGVVMYSNPIPRLVGATATYSCVTGYAIFGTQTRMCTASGWSALGGGGTPTCIG